jgi:hypothetical protein
MCEVPPLLVALITVPQLLHLAFVSSSSSATAAGAAAAAAGEVGVFWSWKNPNSNTHDVRPIC